MNQVVIIGAGIAGLSAAYYAMQKMPAAFAGTDEEKLGKFREIRDLIEQRIRNWLEEQGFHQ